MIKKVLVRNVLETRADNTNTASRSLRLAPDTETDTIHAAPSISTVKTIRQRAQVVELYI